MVQADRKVELTVVLLIPFTESINNDSTSHYSMGQRHAKIPSPVRLNKTTLTLVFFLLIQMWAPSVVSEGDDLDSMEICSNPIAGLGGDCDGRSNADDGTSGITEWVDGIYNFNMTSPTEIEFEASWAIREWDKSGMGLFSSMDNALLADNIGVDDGLPADVLRAAFDNNTDPSDPSSPTVQETLLSEIDGSISQLLSSWGGASTPETNWSDSIQLPNSSGSGDLETVECATDVADNSDGNAFEPPICITTNVVISMNVRDTYGLQGVSASSLESALEGMLIMGSEVTTKFDVSVSPGHRGTYAIQPPPYATVVQAGGTSGEKVYHEDGNYYSGLWSIDWRNPSTSSSQAINGDLDMTMGFRQSATTGVVSIPQGDKSIDLSVVVDLSDESNTFVEVVAGIYQIQSSSLELWNVPPLMPADKASIPVITSDGIRMAYHSGLLELSDLSDNIPLSGIGDAIGNSNGIEVQMGAFQWTHVSQPPLNPGGLNYTHGFGCLRGGFYCLEGTVAMDDTFPVYMKSVSNTFPLSLADLLGGNLGDDANFLDDVEGDDLNKLLNSGVEFSTILSDSAMDSFIGNMLPSGLDADLTMEIVLPSWVSTKDGGDRIEVSYRASGNHIGEISLTGSESFFWNHAICSETVGPLCTDSSPDRLCKSTIKSCLYFDVGLDISKFDTASLLLNKGVVVEFELTINLTVHRIAVPESLFGNINSDSTNIALDVLPSDLIRLIMDIGSRSEEPLDWDFSLCDGELPYCDQTVIISNDNKTGLPGFATRFSNDVKSYIEDESRSLSSDSSNIFGDLDMSAFSVELDIPYEELVDDDETIDDERGLVMRLVVPRVRITTGLANTWADLISMAGGSDEELQVGVYTEAPGNALISPFLSPMASAMEAFTSALANSVLGPEGVRPASNMSIGVGTSSLSSVGADELGIDLGGTVKLTLPLGIQLENLGSSEGEISSVILDKSQRQVITYEIEAGMEDDTLEFSVLLTPTWVLQQIVYYLLVLVLFFVWRVRRRGRKRKKRRRAQALAALEEEVVTQVGYVAPMPTVEVVQVADNGIVIKKRLLT